MKQRAKCLIDWLVDFLSMLAARPESGRALKFCWPPPRQTIAPEMIIHYLGVSARHFQLVVLYFRHALEWIPLLLKRIAISFGLRLAYLLLAIRRLGWQFSQCSDHAKSGIIAPDKMNSTQKQLLRELKPDVWYGFYPDKNSDIEPLPEWFCDEKIRPLEIIRALVESGEICEQVVDGLPQILKPYMKELK